MPSKEELLRLATGGLAEYPPSLLDDLALWCHDICRAIPDVRYCVLGDALQVVAEWFEERGRYGAVFTASVAELDTAFEQLPVIVDEQHTAVAVPLAQALFERVVDVVGRGERGLNDLYS